MRPCYCTILSTSSTSVLTDRFAGDSVRCARQRRTPGRDPRDHRRACPRRPADLHRRTAAVQGGGGGAGLFADRAAFGRHGPGRQTPSARRSGARVPGGRLPCGHVRAAGRRRLHRRQPAHPGVGDGTGAATVRHRLPAVGGAVRTALSGRGRPAGDGDQRGGPRPTRRRGPDASTARPPRRCARARPADREGDPLAATHRPPRRHDPPDRPGRTALCPTSAGRSGGSATTTPNRCGSTTSPGWPE